MLMPAVRATRCRQHINHEHLGFVLAEKSRQRAMGYPESFYRPPMRPYRNRESVHPPVMKTPVKALLLAAVFWIGVFFAWCVR